jgi:hypothetical protein
MQNAPMRDPLNIFKSFLKTKKISITYFSKCKKSYPSSKRNNLKRITPIHILPKLRKITSGPNKTFSRDSWILTNCHSSINSNSGY